MLFTHKFFQSKYLSDRLITNAQNVVPVHAGTPSVTVSTGWQPSQWQSAVNHPTPQQGAASVSAMLLTQHYILAAARLLWSCSRWGSDLDCLVDRGQDRWSPVYPAAAAGWCRERDVPECCLVKDKHSTFGCWKHLLIQQDIAVILAVHLHTKVNKYQFSHCSINKICSFRQTLQFLAFDIFPRKGSCTR